MIFIWGVRPIFFRTDYLTSIWKLPVMFGLFVISVYSLIGLTCTLLVESIFWSVGFIVAIELYGYQALAEQASLFLKSEVALRNSSATNKALYEIPVSIVITKIKKPNAVRFSN
jgi:hypothetical protein